MRNRVWESTIALSLLSFGLLALGGHLDAATSSQSDAFKAALFYLNSNDRCTRVQAAIDLGHLGKEANKAAPELTLLLGTDDLLLANAAEGALVAIGPAASRRVSERLDHAKSSERVARVLMQMGRRGRIRLEKYLESAEPSEALIGVCAAIGTDALEHLIRCVTHEPVERHALRVLAALEEPETALQASVLTEDQARWIRWASGTQSPTEAELLSSLSSARARDRELAARVLANKPSLRRGAVLDALLDAMDDEDDFVQRSALEAIASAPLASAEAQQRATALLESEHQVIRRIALSACLSTLPDSDRLGEEAFDALRDMYLWGHTELQEPLTRCDYRAVEVFLEALQCPVEPMRASAILGLHDLGIHDKSAIEALKAIAANEQDPLHERAGVTAAYLEELPPIHQLRQELAAASGFDRETVIRRISRLGKDAEPFLDELVDAVLTGSPRVSGPAAEALNAIGQPAFDQLVTRLTDPEVGLFTAKVLPIIFGEAGTQAVVKTIFETPLDAHIVALIPELKGEGIKLLLLALNNESVQKEALWALRRLSRSWPGERDKWPLRVVKDADLRLAASWILKTKEPRPDELVEGLFHENALLRESAAYALAIRLSSGPTEKNRFVAALTETLEDKSPDVQRTAAWAIGRLLGSELKAPVGVPGSTYDHVVYPETVKPGLGSGARSVLWLLGANPTGSVPQYEGWHSAVTWHSEKSIVPKPVHLDLLPNGHEHIVASLIRLAIEGDEADSDVTRAAMFALNALGTGCSSQMDELKRLLGTEKGYLAATAMLTMGTEAESALPELERMLDTTPYPVSPIFVVAGIKTQKADAVLLRLLEHENTEISAWTVAAIGSRKDLSPILAEGLRTAYMNGVDIAAGPLSRLGADSVDMFVEMLDNEDRQGVAMLGLREIGPAASSALPRLRELARSDDRFIRVSANRAMRAIEGSDE